MYDFKTLIKLPLLKNSSNTKNDMNIEEYLIEFVYDLEENNRRNIHSEAQMAPIDNDVLNFYNQVLLFFSDFFTHYSGRRYLVHYRSQSFAMIC